MYIHITYSRLPWELMWCFLIYFWSITFILEILREAGVTKPAWPVRPRAGKPQAGQKELEPGLWTPSLCLMSLTRHWLHLVCPHWWHNCKWPGHLFSWSIVFVIKILVKKCGAVYIMPMFLHGGCPLFRDFLVHFCQSRKASRALPQFISTLDLKHLHLWDPVVSS